MKTKLTVIALALLVSGCAQFNSTITDVIHTDGSREQRTVVNAYTLFDSKSELAKLNSGQTGKSQKVEVGSLNQQSSGTNVVALTEAVVRAAVSAAIKP